MTWPTLGWLVPSITICVSAWFLAQGLLHLMYGYLSDAWPTTEGRVLDSRVGKRSRPGRRTGYWPIVHYTYVVDGTEYVARQLSYAKRFHGSLHSVQQVLQKYPPGRQVTVCYDPANPARAVIEPGFSLGNFVIIFIAIVFLIGGVSMVQF